MHYGPDLGLLQARSELGIAARLPHLLACIHSAMQVCSSGSGSLLGRIDAGAQRQDLLIADTQADRLGFVRGRISFGIDYLDT